MALNNLPLHRYLWICAVVAGVAIAAFTLPRHGVPRVGRGFNPGNIAVQVGETLEQLMAVQAWGLNRVTVWVSDINGAEILDVELEHRENGLPLTVSRTTVELTGAGKLPIQFAPARSQRHAEFVLRLRPRSADGAGTVTFEATEGHEYREGRLWLMGAELPFDLVLDGAALTDRPWPAFAGVLHRQTGVHGLEWAFALAYLGGACAIIRFAVTPAAP